MLIGEKMYLIRSSANLSLFWPILLVSLAPNVKIEIEHLMEHFDLSRLVLTCTLSPVCLLLSLAQFWPDISDLEPRFNDLAQNNTNSFYSSVFLSWMSPLIWKGYKAPLEQNDLYHLPRKVHVDENVNKFQKAWNSYLANTLSGFFQTILKISL